MRRLLITLVLLTLSRVLQAKVPELFRTLPQQQAAVLDAPTTRRVALTAAVLRQPQGEPFRVTLGSSEYLAQFADEERDSRHTSRFFHLDGADGWSVATMTREVTVIQFADPAGRAWLLEAPAFAEGSLLEGSPQSFTCDVREPAARTNDVRVTALPKSHRRAVSPPALPGPTMKRLLIAYEPGVLAQKGATVLEAECYAFTDQLNLIARNSLVFDVKEELAGTFLRPYDAADDSLVNLRTISEDPAVREYAKAIQADEVLFLTLHGGNLAFAPDMDQLFGAANGFATASCSLWLQGSYSPAHEVLHMSGLQHDSQNAQVQSNEFPSAREKVLFELRVQGVMGIYADQTGLYYGRIPYISNPALSYKGYAFGDAATNNAAMLEYGGKKVARYHLERQ